MSDSTTTANLINSQHGQDDPAGFVEWLQTQRNVEQPIKDMVSGMAATYRREKSRGLAR